MPVSSHPLPRWLSPWMQGRKIHLWGAADLRGFSTPDSTRGEGYPFALSYAIPMNPLIMAGIRNGPNQDYADEYVRVNDIINDLAERIATEIKRRGFRAQSLAASERTDTVNLQGDFPHKTAATRSGLGWIGRNCQLVTRTHGPWIRLGTVFTDMTILCGPPVERSYCGRCTICVDACPAGALKGNVWYPGLPREDLLDVHACDSWKRKHYFQYHRGHTCGICSAVCPRGLKMLKQPTLSGRMPQ